MATFGWSAGDLVQAISIVYKICKGLKDTGGASSEYQETAAFLHGLGMTLEKLRNIDQIFEVQNRDGLTSMKVQVDLVRDPVMDFTRKMELSFESSLKSNPPKA